MRKLLLISLSFFLFSCEDNCDEDECKESSAIYSFRFVDESLNDLVDGPFARISMDSVFVYGNNEGAFSKLEKEVTVKYFDTIPVFQFNVDNTHQRYLIETRTADTTITDTLGTSYSLQLSECCGTELNSFNARVNGEVQCENCSSEEIHLFTR